jgi:hypothetical protein
LQLLGYADVDSVYTVEVVKDVYLVEVNTDVCDPEFGLAEEGAVDYTYDPGVERVLHHEYFKIGVIALRVCHLISEVGTQNIGEVGILIEVYLASFNLLKGCIHLVRDVFYSSSVVNVEVVKYILIYLSSRVIGSPAFSTVHNYGVADGKQ